MTAIPCQFCGGEAPLVDSAIVYGGRSYGPIYLCQPCGARVGVHKGTETPLGTLANRELREARKRAHAAFDPLWKSGKMRRGVAYAWLRCALGITTERAHIAMLDVDECDRLVEAVARAAKVGGEA